MSDSCERPADPAGPSSRPRPSEMSLEAESSRRGDLIIMRDRVDGSWVVSGTLTPEVGKSLLRALEAAEEILETGDDEEGAAARRADALAMVASAALRRGLGDSAGPGPE